MSTEDLPHPSDRLTELAALAAEITSALDEESLTNAVQRALDRVSPADYSSLYFVDPNVARLRLFYARGYTDEERTKAEATAMDRFPGWVYRNRKMLHVPDVARNPYPEAPATPSVPSVRSRLHLPILFRDECVGVMALASKQTQVFSAEHITELQFVSSMTGVVYANLRHIRAITAQVELVRKQRAELRELSAPILVLGRGALLLPVIGRVDAARADHMQEKLLGAIASHRARAVILDLTGMASLGGDAMDAILRIAKASALMGARCVVSGISARAALAMAGQHVELRGSDIFGSVEGALASVLRSA